MDPGGRSLTPSWLSRTAAAPMPESLKPPTLRSAQQNADRQQQYDVGEIINSHKNLSSAQSSSMQLRNGQFSVEVDIQVKKWGRSIHTLIPS